MVFPSKADELVEKLRTIDPIKSAIEKIQKEKPKKMYAWRKWNGRLRIWEKIYKPYPPRDPYKERKD